MEISLTVFEILVSKYINQSPLKKIYTMQFSFYILVKNVTNQMLVLNLNYISYLFPKLCRFVCKNKKWQINEKLGVFVI